MKYIKWTVVILLSVIVSVAFAKSASSVLGVSTEISMLIICFIALPLIDFIFTFFVFKKSIKSNSLSE
jgi:hypothetical protein